jgi:hypothetical protein
MIDVPYQRLRGWVSRLIPAGVSMHIDILKAKDYPTADIVYRRIEKKIRNISWIP